MRQILNTFRVNRNLRILVLCTWLAESQRPTLEQWWFAVQVTVCGAGVIPPKVKSRLHSKSFLYIRHWFIDLTVTEGMTSRYLTHARTFDTRLYFRSPRYREPGNEANQAKA